MHQEDLRIMLVHLHKIDMKIIHTKNEDRRQWHCVYGLLRHRQIFLPGRISHASTSMAGSSNPINDMPGEPLGALRGISVHPNRSSTPSFRKIDRRRRRKKESQFTEDHNEAVKKIQRWMRRRQQLLEPSLWGMQGRDDTRRRGTKIDIEDSIDDAEHMEKRQQPRNKRYRRGERQAQGDSKVVGREQARERLSVDVVWESNHI